MCTIKLCLVSLLMLAPVVQAAEVYKCVDANGNSTLTDTPCRTLPTKPAPPPAGQAKPSETLKPPKPEPILPPPERQLYSPPAPSPAAPPAAPTIKSEPPPNQG